MHVLDRGELRKGKITEEEKGAQASVESQGDLCLSGPGNGERRPDVRKRRTIWGPKGKNDADGLYIQEKHVNPELLGNKLF